MVKHPHHRLPLLLAIILHSAIICFLFIEITNRKLYFASLNPNTINAFTVSSNQLQSFMPKPTVKPADERPNNPPAAQSMVKPVDEKTKNPPTRTEKKIVLKQETPDNDQLQYAILKKKLMQERSQELKELQKERTKIQHQLVQKQQTEMQQLLKQELTKEQQQLARELNTEANDISQASLGQHTSLIHQAISSHWLKPENLAANDFVKILIQVGPGGEVIEQRIVGSSDSPTLERSAQSAVANASPLPIADDVKVFDKTRKLIIVFRSDGIVSD